MLQCVVQDGGGDSAQPTVLLLEEYLEGKFTKWNTNTGNVHDSDHPVPQARPLLSVILASNHCISNYRNQAALRVTIYTFGCMVATAPMCCAFCLSVTDIAGKLEPQNQLPRGPEVSCSVWHPCNCACDLFRMQGL